VATGSTTSCTNTVYIFYILRYSTVAIASSPVQVFQCGCVPNLIIRELPSTIHGAYFQKGVSV